MDEPEKIKLKFKQFSREQMKAIAKATMESWTTESWAIPEIGQMAGKGVFIGTWQPKDRDGKSLGKTFNVFAAPQDLTDSSGGKIVKSFADTVKRVAALKNWHGHNGSGYMNDTALYNALKDGSYNGEWFIPPRDLLSGHDIDGNKVQIDNLFAHKDKGLLKKTFNARAPDFGGHPDCYWSCTESRHDPSGIWCSFFQEGDDRKDTAGMNPAGGWASCRLVRVELR